MPLGEITQLQHALEPDSRFYSVSVLDQTFHASTGKTTRALRVDVWYRGRPSEHERQIAMNDIAKTALDTIDGIDRYDKMEIAVTAAFDLGIASSRVSYGDGQPIATWTERVGNNALSHSTMESAD